MDELYNILDVFFTLVAWYWYSVDRYSLPVKFNNAPLAMKSAYVLVFYVAYL